MPYAILRYDFVIGGSRVEGALEQREFSHIRGLDGLRALSVLAVMLYHSNFVWMRGGYLGVEVFFAISGYLITSLLLHEAANRGRINLRNFWKRRLMRLLPALWALLFVVGVVGAFWLGTRAAQFRWDLVASFFYHENWYQIHSGGSYFAEQGLPLLRHIWSLAVEEQFYFAWPLLVSGLLWVSRGGRRALVGTTILLALSSFGLMLLLADPGNPSSAKAIESLNRVYLGTDTRAFGILAGALLAMAPRLAPSARTARRVLDLVAILALAGLISLCALTRIEDPLLYRGGFLLVDALTLLVIIALVQPSSGVVKTVLSWNPLVWIGQRSYGIYLWHWPIFLLIGQRQSGASWVFSRWALTFLVAEASYRWLEVPIRGGALGRWLAPSRGTGRRVGKVLAWTVTSLLMAASLRAGRLLAHQPPYVDEVRASLEANARALDGSPSPGAALATAHEAIVRATSRRLELQGDAPAMELPEIPTEAMEGLKVTAIGDSVMKGAAVALQEAGESCLGDEHIIINAEESRPFARAYEIAKTYKKQSRLGDVVVIHLGTNNSSIPEGEFTRLMNLLSDRKIVLFLTAKSDKESACKDVNATLTQLVKGFPNARLFDWNAVVENHPELFYTDQTHLRPVGARFYAASILSQIGRQMGKAKRPTAGKIGTFVGPIPPPATLCL